MGMIEGVIKREGLDSLEAGMLDASGDDQDDQGGDVGSGDVGVSLEGSTRVESPILQEGGLITEIEREAMEVGAGGWFNGVARRFWRVGVDATLLCRQVRIEWG